MANVPPANPLMDYLKKTGEVPNLDSPLCTKLKRFRTFILDHPDYSFDGNIKNSLNKVVLWVRMTKDEGESIIQSFTIDEVVQLLNYCIIESERYDQFQLTTAMAELLNHAAKQLNFKYDSQTIVSEEDKEAFVNRFKELAKIEPVNYKPYLPISTP